MKTIKIFSHGLTWLIIIMLAIPPGIMAQDYLQTDQPAKFTKQELTQMLAPIALYPDSLIAQILMASTYPIEVVEAERWLRINENLKGDALDKALQEKTWDSSVKSLCHFPEVLYAMSEKLEQTTKLGDAFLIQQDEVMDTIQDLRRRAREQGTLMTTEEQNVIVVREIIRIEPTNPQVIYVPVYDPLYVYGPWWYPAYPPYYWYYPHKTFLVSGIFGFGFGIIVGIGISSWSWCDWHHHHIYVDKHKTKRFNRFAKGRKDFEKHVWKHEPYHRRGVVYRHSTVSRHYWTPAQSVTVVNPKVNVKKGQNFERQPKESFRSPIERRVQPDKINRRIDRTNVRTVISSGNPLGNIGKKNSERRKSESLLTGRKNVDLRREPVLRSNVNNGKIRSSEQKKGTTDTLVRDMARGSLLNGRSNSVIHSNMSHSSSGIVGEYSNSKKGNDARDYRRVSRPFSR